MTDTVRNLLTVLGSLAGLGALVSAVVSFRRSRSDISATTATATKSNADAASALNDTLLDQIRLAKEAAADARTASAALEDVLSRLSGVLRLLDELPDDARLGTIRGRLVAALRGQPSSQNDVRYSLKAQSTEGTPA